MDAQLRLDIARELLRLASPAQRGLRRMVLNTRTGRRAYWVQVPKPKTIEKKQMKTAKQLGIPIEEIRMATDFHLDGKTKGGSKVAVTCERNGDVSFKVNDSSNVGSTTGGDAIGAGKLAKRLMREGMESHPKGTIYRCSPFDYNNEKNNSKKDFYQRNGFGERIGYHLFAMKGDNDLHPIDYSYMKEIKREIEQFAHKSDGGATKRILSSIKSENDQIDSELSFLYSTESDVDDLINNREDRLSQNQERMEELWDELLLSVPENIRELSYFIQNHAF